MRKVFKNASLCLLVSLAAACLGVQDERPASLTLQVYFEGDGAPDSVTFRLYEIRGDSRTEIVSDVYENFYSGDSVLYERLGPGLYEVTVEGENRRSGERWASGCADLLVDRFDELYDCDVWFAVEGRASGSNNSDDDAGM